MNKTKVIAVRVTEEEYDLLVNLEDERGNLGLSKLVYVALADTIREAKELRMRQVKAHERKLKRLAKKEAVSGL